MKKSVPTQWHHRGGYGGGPPTSDTPRRQATHHTTLQLSPSPSSITAVATLQLSPLWAQPPPAPVGDCDFAGKNTKQQGLKVAEWGRSRGRILHFMQCDSQEGQRATDTIISPLNFWDVELLQVSAAPSGIGIWRHRHSASHSPVRTTPFLQCMFMKQVSQVCLQLWR